MVKNFRKRKFDQIERDKRREEIEDLNIKVKGYSDQIDSLKREIIEWKERDEKNQDNANKLHKLFNLGIIDEHGNLCEKEGE